MRVRTFIVSSAVELRNELRLQVVFHVVYKEIHDSFRNAVLNVLSHDQKVGLDQAFYKTIDLIITRHLKQQ